MDGVTLERIRDPVVLPCGHSFDRSTVAELRPRMCPNCRRRFEPQDVIKNYQLAELLDGTVDEEDLLSDDDANNDPAAPAPAPAAPAPAARPRRRRLLWLRRIPHARPSKGAMQGWAVAGVVVLFAILGRALAPRPDPSSADADAATPAATPSPTPEPSQRLSSRVATHVGELLLAGLVLLQDCVFLALSIVGWAFRGAAIVAVLAARFLAATTMLTMKWAFQLLRAVAIALAWIAGHVAALMHSLLSLLW